MLYRIVSFGFTTASHTKNVNERYLTGLVVYECDVINPHHAFLQKGKINGCKAGSRPRAPLLHSTKLLSILCLVYNSEHYQ